MGMILSEVKGLHDVTFCSAQLSVWFADIFELINDGKPNVKITLEIIELRWNYNLKFGMGSTFLLCFLMLKMKGKVKF